MMHEQFTAIMRLQNSCLEPPFSNLLSHFIDCACTSLICNLVKFLTSYIIWRVKRAKIYFKYRALLLWHVQIKNNEMVTFLFQDHIYWCKGHQGQRSQNTRTRTHTRSGVTRYCCEERVAFWIHNIFLLDLIPHATSSYLFDTFLVR